MAKKRAADLVPEAEWAVEWLVGRGSLQRALVGELSVGRSVDSDIALNDPYVSRHHCVIRVVDGQAFVDARGSTNAIEVEGQLVETAWLGRNDSFVVGQTRITLRALGPGSDVTVVLSRPRALTLRASSRELLDPNGRVLHRFSAAEYAAFSSLAHAYPEAADHGSIARAVWGDYPSDRYLLHRLLQRVRQRLGSDADLVENVRGGGYRLREPVNLA